MSAQPTDHQLSALLALNIHQWLDLDEIQRELSRLFLIAPERRDGESAAWWETASLFACHIGLTFGWTERRGNLEDYPDEPIQWRLTAHGHEVVESTPEGRELRDAMWVAWLLERPFIDPIIPS